MSIALDRRALAAARRLPSLLSRADLTINELPPLTLPAPNGIVPIWQNGETYGIQASLLATVQPTSSGVGNVMTFGATGNGTTNDAPAIQAALNAGSAYFPPGTYLISTGISIPQNRMLFGVAGQSIIIQAPNANLSAMFYSGNIVGGVLSFIDWENITVEGLVFDGNGSNQTLGALVSQGALVLYGSNFHVRFCRFQNCGTAAVSNNQIATGLLLGCSLENPPKGARLTANYNEYLNCYGVACWLTNAKGGFNNPNASPDTYGNPGLSDVSHQTFYYCRHGLYIEDRCNGWFARGIQYWGDSNNYLTTGGNAVSLAYSTSGEVSVQAKFAGSALYVGGGTPGAGGAWSGTKNVIFDVTAENCAFAGVRLVGTAAFSGQVNGNIAAGVTSIPVAATTNPGSVCANAWILIAYDGAHGSEWVQAAGPIVAGAIPLYLPTVNAHNNGSVVSTDTGLTHVQGRVCAINCGGTGDNAGVYIQSVMDSVIDLTAFDTRQYGAPLSNPASGITQYYGVKITASTRVLIRGNGLANRDTAFFDDGTNVGCFFDGILGSINDGGTRVVADALRYTGADVNYASIFKGKGAPAATMGKAGDIYERLDGVAGAGAIGSTRYVNIAGTWTRAPIQAIGRATFSGTGAQTAFLVAHGLGSSPTHANVTLFACPTAALAGGWTYAWDATNITVNFAVAPANAANNVAFDYEAWV